MSQQEREDHIAIARAMHTYGGGFFSRIGEALFHADASNTRKIKETWPEEWEKYKMMSKRMGNGSDVG